MTSLNRNGPLVQVIITAVGGLVVGIFGLLLMPIRIHRGPTSVDIIWTLATVSVNVIVGAVLFSRASKR